MNINNKNISKNKRTKSAGPFKVKKNLINKGGDKNIKNIKNQLNTKNIKKRAFSSNKNQKAFSSDLNNKNSKKIKKLEKEKEKEKNNKKPKSINLIQCSDKKKIYNKINHKSNIKNLNDLKNIHNKPNNIIKKKEDSLKSKNNNKFINNEKQNIKNNDIKIINQKFQDKKDAKKSFSSQKRKVSSSNPMKKNIIFSYNKEFQNNKIPSNSVNKNVKKDIKKTQILQIKKQIPSGKRITNSHQKENNAFQNKKNIEMVKKNLLINKIFKNGIKSDKIKNNKQKIKSIKSVDINKKIIINKEINNNNENNINKNNEYILKKNENIPIINTQIKNYSKPTLIGLNNVGANSFINSILQCLSQTESLTNYFMNEKRQNKIYNKLKDDLKNGYLTLASDYVDLINKLWAKNESEFKSVSSEALINKINKMNPSFNKDGAGDIKDFIIFILEQLHRELKKSIDNDSKKPDCLNQYDRTNSFNNFFYEFKKDCSIISDIFSGIIETTNICLYCKKKYNSKNLSNPICYNYQIFNCLEFPLEEVKKMKYKNNNNNDNDNETNVIMNNLENIINIYDCFNYHQKNELFTGENKNYCNICKQLYDSIYSSKVYISPNCLILILKRGKEKIYNIKLDFPEILDITQFVLKKESPTIIYNLYGVLSRIGESRANSNFAASCKSPVDAKWYRYNDSLVNPITDVQKEVINFGTPYILFYKKINS